MSYDLKFSAEFRPLDLLLEFIDEITQDWESSGPNTPYRHMLAAIFARSAKMARAARILCSEGYGEDAAVLARSLTDTHITLAFMQAGDSDRLATAFDDWGHVLKWRKIKRMMKEGVMTPEEITKRQPEIDAVRKEHDRAVALHGFKSGQLSWSGMSNPEMAQRAGLSAIYYSSFQFFSEYTHTTSLTLTDYVEMSPTHNILSFLPSENMIATSLHSTYLELLQITSIWNTNFRCVKEDDPRLKAFTSRLIQNNPHLHDPDERRQMIAENVYESSRFEGAAGLINPSRKKAQRALSDQRIVTSNKVASGK